MKKLTAKSIAAAVGGVVLAAALTGCVSGGRGAAGGTYTSQVAAPGEHREAALPVSLVVTDLKSEAENRNVGTLPLGFFPIASLACRMEVANYPSQIGCEDAESGTLQFENLLADDIRKAGIVREVSVGSAVRPDYSLSGSVDFRRVAHVHFLGVGGLVHALIWPLALFTPTGNASWQLTLDLELADSTGNVVWRNRYDEIDSAMVGIFFYENMAHARLATKVAPRTVKRVVEDVHAAIEKDLNR